MARQSPAARAQAERGISLAEWTARGIRLGQLLAYPRASASSAPDSSQGQRQRGGLRVRSPGAGDGSTFRSAAGPMEEPSGKPLSCEEKEKVPGCEKD